MGSARIDPGTSAFGEISAMSRSISLMLLCLARWQLPTRNHAKNTWKTCGRAAGSDAFGCNRFRHAKALRAEGEHRGVRVLEIEFPPIDLGDVGEHGSCVAPVLLDQGREVAEQLLLLNVL